MTLLANWLNLATPAEREELAQFAQTSVNYLYQLAGCHTKNPGVMLAWRLSLGTLTANRKNPELPYISLEALAKMCMKDEAENVG